MNICFPLGPHSTKYPHDSIEIILEELRSFQEQNPTSHIGGSIGLMLHGVNLQRCLLSSDLDIIIDVQPVLINRKNVDTESSSLDFDIASPVMCKDGKYLNVEIRICPEPSFEVIEYEGHAYNVSKLRDILYRKTKYALRKVRKHQLDIITINTGIRPVKEIINNDTLFNSILSYTFNKPVSFFEREEPPF